MTASDVLKRMAEAYATARTYEDTGTVRVVSLKEEGRRERERGMPFSTTFERPLKFRFQYQDDIVGATWIAHADGPARLRFGRRKEQTLPLSRAIASLTGVSSGSAHRVPRLLAPDTVNGWSTADLSEPILESSEAVEETLCHRLSGRTHGGHAETVWIGTRDFLIRRVFDRKVFDEASHQRVVAVFRQYSQKPPPSFRPFTAETTTSYQPVLNGPVNQGLFSEG